MNLDRAMVVKGRPKIYHVVLTIIKISAGLVLLVLSLREIQLDSLWSGIRSANLAWLCLAVVSVLVGLALKLWRWLILIKNYHIHASFSRLFSAFFTGQAANILLPLRGGELIRLGYFMEEKKILPEAASTILLEKYLDLLALSVAILIVTFRISVEHLLDIQGWLIPLTIALTVLLFSVIIFGPSILSLVKESKFLPNSIAPWLEQWVQASLWLRHPMQVLPGVLLTCLIWGVMWLTNLLLFKSLGIALGGTAGGLVLVLVYVGLLPALMPGNIGPFYFFASLALVPFGIMHGQALVYAMLLHAIVTLPPLLGGAIGLFMHTPRPHSL